MLDNLDTIKDALLDEAARDCWGVARKVLWGAIPVGFEWVRGKCSTNWEAIRCMVRPRFDGKDLDTAIREVPSHFWLRTLPLAVAEDRDAIRKVWAELISNAIDPDFPEDRIHIAFVDIISNLDPTDVLILSWCRTQLVDKAVWWDFSEAVEVSFQMEDILTDIDISEHDYYISVHNLIRIQCATGFTLTKFGGGKSSEEPCHFYLTRFGLEFMNACTC